MVKSFLQLVFGNGFSKILGLLREVLIAYFFGTSFIADSYRVAQSIILLPTQLIMGNAFQQAFIPSYKNAVKNRGGKTLFSTIFYCFLVLSLLFTSIFIIFSNHFVKWISPGFTLESQNFTSDLISIMSLGIPFYIFTYFLIYILNSEGEFGYNSSVAITQNVLIIISILAATYLSSPVLLGYGFNLAFVVFFFIIIFKFKRSNKLHLEYFTIKKNRWSTLKPFIKALLPLICFMLFTQTNIFIERYVTSTFKEGSIAAVDYARTLYETPLFLLGIPLATISLTYFSEKKWEESKNKIEETILFVFIIFFPISSLFFMKSNLFITLLYARGEFTNNSILMTSDVLKGLSIGLWAMAVSTFLQRIYNAYFRNFEMLILTGIGIVINIALNFFWVRDIGLIGVGLAYSISSILQAILLISRLQVNHKKILNYLLILTTFSVLYTWLLSLISVSNIWFELVLISLVSAIYWLFIFLLVPSFRKQLIVVKNIFIKNKRVKINKFGG